MLSAGIAGPIT